MTGLFKPSKKNRLIGSDFAGVVAAIGKNVSVYIEGDEVFGEASLGSFGEFNAVKQHMLALKPSNASFEEAACLGVAGLTALQGLQEHGQLKEGETVLINGSSGGVGHYALQIAKAMGAEVTAVCSAKNAEFVRTLGASKVIDYNKESIQELQGNYDLVLDVHGNMRYKDFKRLANRGVMIGFTSFGLMIGTMLKKTFGKYPLKSFVAEPSKKDLTTLAKFYENGKLKTMIDRSYPFEQLPDAITFIEKMHTSGKVAITHA